MKISLNTSLGAIALAVVASAECAETIAKLAMQYCIFHQAPALAFKKGSGFKRDDSYSPELQAAVAKAVKSALEAAGFADVEVVASEKPATESLQDKVMADLIKLGWTPPTTKEEKTEKVS